jgi:diguanylate cyclase (GGDEF)-like protein/PAS domain S-box-containing protein
MSPADTEDSAAQIYAEQVRHLYRLSRSGYFGTLIGASIMTFALWEVADHIMLAGWFTAVVAITLGRFLLYRAYFAAGAANASARSWANRFSWGAIAMGCMWGILGTVLFPYNSIPHQFLVIFVIGGMAMSAAVVLAPVKHVFYGFAFPALAPLTVVLFQHGGTLHILMGALTLVFTFVISGLAVATKEDVLASTWIKFENADLIARLSAANEQVQQSNDRLEEKIRQQERIQEELRQASQKFHALINAAPLAIVVRDAGGLIERWNPAAERMFGWSEAEVLGKTVPLYPPGKEEEGERYRSMVLRGEAFSDVEAVRLRRDGTLLTVSISGAPIYDDKGGATGVLAIIADITARKASEQRQELQTAITRLLAESRTVEEALPRVIQTMCEKLGWACGSRWVLNKRENMLRCAEAWGIDSPGVQEFVAETRAQLNPWTGSVAGVVRRVWDSAGPVWVTDVLQDPKFRRGPAARKAGLHAALGFPVVIVEDFYGVMEFFATEVRPPNAGLMEFARQLGSQIGQFIARIEAEQNLRFVATHDALTLLPNRTMFGDRLSQALAQAHRYNRHLALLFVDLDGFKTVNDTLGHDAGDMLLREVGARLRACLREGDVIGRIGGDEFVVLIEEFGALEQIALVARKIIDTVAQPVPVHGQECRVTASIGIAAYPQDGKDSQTLLKNADGAMYRAKELGKNRFQFYSV